MMFNEQTPAETIIDQPLPQYKEPFVYAYHHDIDIQNNGKHLHSAEYYAKSPRQSIYEYGMTTIDGWMAFYVPEINTPPEDTKYEIKFCPRIKSESIVSYGLHTITALCAIKQNEEQFKGSTVVDLGAGSGILALAALKLGAKHVFLYEKDSKSIKEAKLQFELNEIEDNRFTIIADTLENVQLYANELKEVEIAIANIGKWENYGDAYLLAASALNYTPKIKYYIAGGHGYINYHDNKSILWNTQGMAGGEKEINTALNLRGLQVKNTIDGHTRGSMNCSRAFVANKY